VFGINILSLLDYPYHFLVYFVLAFLAAHAFFWRRVPTTRQLLRVFALVMVIAVVDEVQQLFVLSSTEYELGGHFYPLSVARRSSRVGQPVILRSSTWSWTGWAQQRG